MGNITPFENCVDFVDWLADSIIQCHQDRAMLESNLSGWQERNAVFPEIRANGACRWTMAVRSFFLDCSSFLSVKLILLLFCFWKGVLWQTPSSSKRPKRRQICFLPLIAIQHLSRMPPLATFVPTASTFQLYRTGGCCQFIST